MNVGDMKMWAGVSRCAWELYPEHEREMEELYGDRYWEMLSCPSSVQGGPSCILSSSVSLGTPDVSHSQQSTDNDMTHLFQSVRKVARWLVLVITCRRPSFRFLNAETVVKATSKHHWAELAISISCLPDLQFSARCNVGAHVEPLGYRSVPGDNTSKTSSTRASDVRNTHTLDAAQRARSHEVFPAYRGPLSHHVAGGDPLHTRGCRGAAVGSERAFLVCGQQAENGKGMLRGQLKHRGRQSNARPMDERAEDTLRSWDYQMAHRSPEAVHVTKHGTDEDIFCVDIPIRVAALDDDAAVESSLTLASLVLTHREATNDDHSTVNGMFPQKSERGPACAKEHHLGCTTLA